MHEQQWAKLIPGKEGGRVRAKAAEGPGKAPEPDIRVVLGLQALAQASIRPAHSPQGTICQQVLRVKGDAATELSRKHIQAIGTVVIPSRRGRVLPRPCRERDKK